MLTNDPNRLLVIIRDRHIMVSRLEAALAEAKRDNAGDAFILSRFIKHHKEQLKELEAKMRGIHAEYHARKKQEMISHEAEQVAILRMQVRHWSIDE
jgi:arginine deiminase